MTLVQYDKGLCVMTAFYGVTKKEYMFDWPMIDGNKNINEYDIIDNKYLLYLKYKYLSVLFHYMCKGETSDTTLNGPWYRFDFI